MELTDTRGLLVEPEKPPRIQEAQTSTPTIGVMLTVGDLAVEMRLTTDPGDIPPEYVDILTRALSTAISQVEGYAGTSTPQQTMDLAAAKMAGYLVDSPSYARMPLIAFRNSGCESLLSRWHVVRSVTV